MWGKAFEKNTEDLFGSLAGTSCGVVHSAFFAEHDIHLSGNLKKAQLKCL